MEKGCVWSFGELEVRAGGWGNRDDASRQPGARAPSAFVLAKTLNVGEAWGTSGTPAKEMMHMHEATRVEVSEEVSESEPYII